MMVCNCMLAGTPACINCPNNTNPYRGPTWYYQPPTYSPPFNYFYTPPLIDVDELAKKVAELLKEKEK